MFNLGKKVILKNMTFEDSIEKMLGLYKNIEEKCINIGPDSRLTTSCAYQFVGAYLSFDSINWNDILVLDVKSESFITGMAQKVLDKFLSNSNKRIFIHLCVGEDNNNPSIIQEIFDYFNQIEYNKDKMIYLEYLVDHNRIDYLKPLINGDMKTDIFCDVEIQLHKDDDLCIIEKLDNIKSYYDILWDE